MARNKKTFDYLEELKNKGYNRYDDLSILYDKWKYGLDIKDLSKFLAIILQENDIIKPKYLGVNT